MYLLRSELHLSFPKIAGELGRKDHTTAIHSVEKIEKAIKLDYIIREQVSLIREKLYAKKYKYNLVKICAQPAN